MLFAIIVQIYIFTKNEVGVRLEIHCLSSEFLSTLIDRMIS